MSIISNPLFTAGIGFVLGLLTWFVQQQFGDRRQKRRVLVLLYRENVQNLNTLEVFWSQVIDTLRWSDLSRQ